MLQWILGKYGGTVWRLVVSFTRRPLYSKGKSPRYPSGRRLGRPRAYL